MSLPEYEDVLKGTYTADEVQHIIARKVMQHRMVDLEAKIAAGETNVNAGFSRLEGTLLSIQQAVKKGADDIRDIKNEIKEEIKEDYATKMELERLEHKVDKMWAKITIAVSVSVVLLELGLKFIGVE